MTTISAVRDGLKTRLETLDAVRVYDEIPAAAAITGTASAAVIQLSAVNYDEAFANQGDGLTFTIVLIVSKLSDRTGIAKLDGFLDPTYPSTTSVRAAVNGNLGSTVAYATVVSATGPGELTIGVGEEAGSYLACEFTVEVKL